MKSSRIPIPGWLKPLPWVSVTLAGLWLVMGLVVGIGSRGDLRKADDELRSVARQVIHQPELEVPGRLLPVARDLMPGFESNEMFSFLRKGEDPDGDAQRRFDERAAKALARFDSHPTRVLGLVPAQPTVHAFLSHALLPAGLLNGLLTLVMFLLAAPVLERLWGWRVFLPAITLMALGGAGAYALIHFGADRALLGGGAIVAGLVAAVLVRFRTEELDFLAWLPSRAAAELVAPAWVLGGVWLVYELAAWLSMPVGVLGLAHHPGFAAHAGGALVGLGVALGVERLGWEAEPPVVEAKAEAAPRFDLARIEAMMAAGQGDAALEVLEAAVRRNARHRDAVTLYFKVCCQREQPERAGPVLAQLVREELRRGAEDVALARWRDLVEHVPNARLDSMTLIRIATILRRDGDDELALFALQRVVDSKGLPGSVAAEVARLAAAFAPELAAQAAQLALGDAELAEDVRHELEALAGSAGGGELKDDEVPVAPTGKELPPNVFYENQDRSSFGQLEDLSVVEDFPAGAVLDALPRVVDLDGLVVHLAERGEQRVDYSRVRAISVAGVHGLGPKPVLLVDVLIDGSGTKRPLSVLRLRSDHFDPRSLAPNASGGIEALRALVAQLLAGSEALPLPDAQSAVLRPPKIYESLASYEQEVLAPVGLRLG